MKDKMQDKLDLIGELFRQRNVAYATLDRMIAMLTHFGICPDCGASQTECTESLCEERQAQVEAWLGDVNSVLMEVNEE